MTNYRKWGWEVWTIIAFVVFVLALVLYGAIQDHQKHSAAAARLPERQLISIQCKLPLDQVVFFEHDDQFVTDMSGKDLSEYYQYRVEPARDIFMTPQNHGLSYVTKPYNQIKVGDISCNDSNENWLNRAVTPSP